MTDAVEVAIPELRIVSDALWTVVQAEIAKRQAQQAAAGNPAAAHRTRVPALGPPGLRPLRRALHRGEPHKLRLPRTP